MDRLAPSVSKQALKCLSSHKMNPGMCAGESNLHSMGTRSIGSMDESHDGETSSVEGATKLPSPSPSFEGEPAAGRDCSSARIGESLVFHDSDDHHEASDVGPELESDGEESSCSSDRTSFDWMRYTHSPLPVLVRDQGISPQKEKTSFHNQSPTSPEERCTLNAEGLRTKAGVNEISQERMNASLSPSPSLSSSCESAGSIQKEGCGQPRKHHKNKYLNFDHSVVILPPPPSPLSYLLFDLSVSSEDGSEDEENPPADSRSVRRELAAEAERQRSERRDRAEQKEREERQDRRQKRELTLQPLRVRYQQWEKEHAKEQEELRVARETKERLQREFLEWRLTSAQQQFNEERESEGQETRTKKVKKNRWWKVSRWWKGNLKEKEQTEDRTWQMPSARGEEEEEDEIRSIDWDVPTLQPKKRRKIQFGWKGFGKKSKKKRDKKKERHQLEEKQVWANDWQQVTPKPKKRKNIEIVWKGFGKKNKKDKKKQRHQLEEEPSVWVDEDGQLPTENVEPTPKVKRSQKKVEIVWRGFGKKKKRQENNQEHDQLEEEAGTSVRAEVEMQESLAMQSQKPKKTKKKRGLFSKTLGNKKKKTERRMEQEHPRDEAGLSVRAEEVKPSPSDRAEPTPSKAKKSKNKPGLFSKLFAKKKKKGKDYQQQLEETTVSGGAEGPAYGPPAPERDLGMHETDQGTLSSMPRRRRTSSFTDIL